MPQLLEETEVRLERLDLTKRIKLTRPTDRQGFLTEPRRSTGAHLSGILWYIATESGLKKAAESIEEEELPLRMALGLAWEEFAVSLYPDTFWQPGEKIEDGIAMTSDGLTVTDEGDLQLEEFKLTWKKVRSGQQLIEDEWYWMQQGRGYCWSWGVERVRWHICYVNGDYRGSGPIYKRYTLQFSPEEIERTAQMLVKNKEKALAKGFGE